MHTKLTEEFVTRYNTSKRSESPAQGVLQKKKKKKKKKKKGGKARGRISYATTVISHDVHDVQEK